MSFSSIRDARIHANCFLIGGTTAFLDTVVLPGVVKPMRKWSSDSFRRYWCLLDELTVNHVSAFGTYEPPLANINDTSKATRSDLGGLESGAPSELRAFLRSPI